MFSTSLATLLLAPIAIDFEDLLLAHSVSKDLIAIDVTYGNIPFILVEPILILWLFNVDLFNGDCVIHLREQRSRQGDGRVVHKVLSGLLHECSPWRAHRDCIASW